MQEIEWEVLLYIYIKEKILFILKELAKLHLIYFIYYNILSFLLMPFFIV